MVIDNILDKITNGPKNDYIANLDISKVNGGYYANMDPINAFIEHGISNILDQLPKQINYADLGGGDGILTSNIKTYLQDKEHLVNAILVDANPNYLKQSLKYNMLSVRGNLEHLEIQGCNLITMRGVNHYNSLKTQKTIFKNVFNSLVSDSFFVSSICSGNDDDCKLKSQIANLSSLGRAYELNQIHSTSEKEYFDLLKEAGFATVILTGYAPTQSWSPVDLWKRSNDYFLELARNNNDKKLLEELIKREDLFFKEADKLVIDYVTKVKKMENPVERSELYSLIPDTTYPIFVAKK